MDHTPEYYIDKINEHPKIVQHRGNLVECTIDNTKILVYRMFSRQFEIKRCYMVNYNEDNIHGWYYTFDTKEIVMFDCTKHYIQRFKERYLVGCKLGGLDIFGPFAKRIMKAQPTEDKRYMAESLKGLRHKVYISEKKGYKYVEFFTVVKSKKYMTTKKEMAKIVDDVIGNMPPFIQKDIRGGYLISAGNMVIYTDRETALTCLNSFTELLKNYNTL